MRKLFPLLDAPVGGTKPSTLKRFDAVFSAISLLIGLAGYSFSSTLSSLIQILYYRIVSFTFGEPQTLINSLRNHRLIYIAYIRAGRAYANDLASTLKYVPFETLTGESASSVSPLVKIQDFRDRLISEGTNPSHICNFDRIVIALLSLDRIVSFNPGPDFSTITAGTKYGTKPDKGSKKGPDPNVPFFSDLMPLCEALGITPASFKAEYKRQVKLQRHEIMSTAGPNGPASWTAHNDAMALMGDTRLYKAFKYLCEQSGLNWLLQDMVSCVSLPSYDTTRDHQLQVARLHHFEEWGGKVRIVAILDYWTQILLTPLHNTLFHFLDRIESDGTFDQDAAALRVQAFTNKSKAVINSFDLTAATDRLPVDVQVEVLSFLMNPNFAKTWKTLLTARGYYHKETNATYTYGAGQPMGARSSWAMFALTHHLIVQQAAANANVSKYTDYALLGDDVVLCDSAVSTQYLALMALLYVSINQAKSILHIPDNKPAAEFCKRVFIAGVEYTSFPVKMIAKTILNGRLAPSLQNELVRRGFSGSTSWLMKWIIGLVDKESGRYLAILNLIPSHLSSLTASFKIGSKLGNITSWFGDSFTVTNEHITEAYVYTAVTEQLKRLDNLLRQAQIIHSAIEHNAIGYSTFDGAKVLGWNYSDPTIDLAELAASMPKLSPTHPILKASNDEMERISVLLANLRGGHSDVTERAQRQLLDMFRSSLVDAWHDSDAARGQADRSLIQRALTNLCDIVLNRVEKIDKTPAHYMEYTVNLAYVNRLWSVSWELGKGVHINAVKSRVLATAEALDLRLGDIDSNTSIQELFHVPRKRRGSSQPSSAPRTPVERVARAAADALVDNLPIQ